MHSLEFHFRGLFRYLVFDPQRTFVRQNDIEQVPVFNSSYAPFMKLDSLLLKILVKGLYCLVVSARLFEEDRRILGFSVA